MVDSISHIGTTVYYSATLPATNTAAGFEALTWIQITRPVSAPRFGVEHNTVTAELLSGFSDQARGAGRGRTTEMMFSDDVTNGVRATGQAGIRAIAAAGGGDVALKVGRGSGSPLADGGLALVEGDPVEYAVGFVHSLTSTEKTAGAYLGFSMGFTQRLIEVYDNEPAA